MKKGGLTPQSRPQAFQLARLGRSPRVRMQRFKKSDAPSNCCGATPATDSAMSAEHIKQRKLFPDLALSPDDLQVLSADCNHGKGTTDWRGEQARAP